jgi:hypothetical protein
MRFLPERSPVLAETNLRWFGREGNFGRNNSAALDGHGGNGKGRQASSVSG